MIECNLRGICVGFSWEYLYIYIKVLKGGSGIFSNLFSFSLVNYKTSPEIFMRIES